MKNPEKRRARGVVFSPEDRKGKTIDEKLSVGGRASRKLGAAEEVLFLGIHFSEE